MSTTASSLSRRQQGEQHPPNSSPSPTRPVPAVVKAAAGSVGGAVEACFLQPVDVIKTRLQLDKTGAYRGIVHCGRTIASSEGVVSLWKGLTPFATHLTLKYALRMGTNALFQGGLRRKDGTLSPISRFISGFGAGVCEAVLIVTPFEVVKIRLQQQRGADISNLRYHGPFHAARTIWFEEGFRGLWAGVAPTVLRNGTNQACMFSTKFAIDTVVWRKKDGDGKILAPWQSMISGFVAGVVGPVATGPFDVIKTRLMAQGRENLAAAAAGVPPSSSSSPPAVRYKGLLHALVTIPRQEGLFTLWKGLLPRLMRIPPGQAITWAVADQVIGAYERSVAA